jgi:hypothetical protein
MMTLSAPGASADAGDDSALQQRRSLIEINRER